MAKPFNDDDDAAVRAGFGDGKGAAEIGRNIGRPVQSITDRAKFLNCWVSPIDDDGWRPEGIATLRRLWTMKDGHGRFNYSVTNVASKIKRDVHSVVAKATKIGLEPREYIPPNTNNNSTWMEDWARRANAAPERAVEKPGSLYYGHPIAIEALNAVFDQSRFSE